MIAEACTWARGMEWTEDTDFTYETIEEWRVGYARIQERVAEMELSWYRSLVLLIRLAAGHDGDLTFSWDSDRSLFWQHPKTGYHGGLIFHPSYAKLGTVPLPVGSWSTHT